MACLESRIELVGNSQLSIGGPRDVVLPDRQLNRSRWSAF